MLNSKRVAWRKPSKLSNTTRNNPGTLDVVGNACDFCEVAFDKREDGVVYESALARLSAAAAALAKALRDKLKK